MKTDDATMTGGVDTLPEAGDERRDVLRERADRLDERAESELAEGGTIDPRRFRVENEIAQHFNELDVSHQDPSYDYGWVWIGQNGLHIKMKLAMKWEVVQGDMEEAIELRGMGADSTRKLGDVILMRIRKDLHLVLKRREREIRERQHAGVVGVLQELGERHRGRGLIVHTDANSTLSAEAIKILESRTAARSVAGKFVDDNLRSGTMPGRPAPGSRR